MGPAYGQEQLRWLERSLLPQLPSAAQLLDLCCGTGQLIQPLLERGYQVTGLDGSEAMLNYARENAPRANFWLDDARTFSSPIQFDAVFSTSASLNHIMSLEALTEVFQNVYRSLQPSGFFLFDLNHPGQMQKWWRGQIVEGEIDSRYAWILRPSYEPTHHQGAFEVSLFEAPRWPSQSWGKRLMYLLRAPLYRLLSLRRLTRFRLKLLCYFSRLEPDWQRSDLNYPVKGHAIADVRLALQQTGFEQICIETIEGADKIDDNYSAHFICRKGAQP
ncbi:MAG: class I SAM-dependent methyltransferase [Synechococcales cyanobacterium CRU_2_2]|nr:class I SAM-dependent methyltransferase [Synechococcales cyanobacterium CRU_2_2]